VSTSVPTTVEPVPVRTTRRGFTAGRVAPLSAPAFVVLVLAGNSLTETVATAPGDAAEAALATFAAKAEDPLVALGIVMELTGFVLLAVFTAWLVDALRRRAAFGVAGALAVIGAVLMLAVKLGSAAPYLTGVLRHASLSPVRYGAAVALRRAGLLGRLGHVAGLGTGTLGVVAALAGVVVPQNANPLPFLAGLLWLAAVGVRVTLRG
jgi:hypothetical protein